MSKDNTSNFSSSNNSIKNFENNKHKFIESFDTLIDSFWKEKLWKSNPANIFHKKIYKIIYEYQKIKKKLDKSSNNSDLVKFNINNNLDFFIIDEAENINDKLCKLIDTNIMFLKTHSECFTYYNKLQNNYFNIKNSLVTPHYIKLNITENIIENVNSINTCKPSKNYINDINNFNDFKTFIDFEPSKLDAIINELYKSVNLNENKINTAIQLSINKNKKILIIDGENILKCFKIQYFIKTQLISQKEFNKYFNTWINGNYSEFNDVCSSNLSLTEYSSSIKFIEPYTSLSMDTNIKFYLLKKIVESIFTNYICIVICNSKMLSNDIIDDFSINNSVFIPISYDKKDIREKDDHLIVYLYYYFTRKNIQFDLLSSDKFKWFTFLQDNNQIKNVKFLFNFDNNKIEYILSNAYENDIIQINNNIYPLSINYFPISTIEIFNIKNTDKFNDIYNFIDQLTNFFINISFNNFTKDDNNYLDIIDKYYNILTNIYNYIKIWEDEFSIIFPFLEKYSKNEIFNLLKKINQNNFKIKHIDFERLRLKINDYKKICDIYVLIKHINININTLLTNKIHIITCKIFSLVIEIYDSIYSNIFKIRKLSNNKCSINLFFMELGSMFIYIKKIGYFKKQL
jgi:hypothetical protein